MRGYSHSKFCQEIPFAAKILDTLKKLGHKVIFEMDGDTRKMQLFDLKLFTCELDGEIQP